MQEFCALCSYFKIIILNFIYISFKLFLQLELRFSVVEVQALCHDFERCFLLSVLLSTTPRINYEIWVKFLCMSFQSFHSSVIFSAFHLPIAFTALWHRFLFVFLLYFWDIHMLNVFTTWDLGKINYHMLKYDKKGKREIRLIFKYF